MRFASLTLWHYGAVARRDLRFEPSPGLAVLYGPNEAGKSTCLDAVIDFLFGIPHTSPRGERYGYDKMRLDATLVLADGREVDLSRRKGQQNRTLRAGDGTPLPDATLAAWLGGTGRERFRTLFGIDHATLRSGGDQLLTSEGEIGRLIVEAGGGLSRLVERMEGLKREADGQFAAKRSGDRAFYQALDAYNAADRDIKAGLLTREQYAAQANRQAAAAGCLAGLHERLRDRRAAVARLTRLVRVVPDLRRLASLDAGLAGFADIAGLPSDFADAAEAALAAQAAAAHDDAVAGEQLAKAEAQHRAVAVPPALLAAEPEIRAVQDLAKGVAERRRDRPGKERERATVEADVLAHLETIGLAAGADWAVMLPDKAALDRVLRLAADGAGLAAAADGARAALAAARQQQVKLAARQAERRQRGLDQPVGVSDGDFARLAGLDAEIARLADKAERLDGELQHRLDSLGFSSLAALQAFRCPDAEVVQGEIGRRATLADACARLAERIAGRREAWAAAIASVERLAAAGELPSTAAVAVARRHRAAAWTAIRQLYVADAPAIAERPALLRAGDASRLDEAMAAADDLADRRANEAERLAALEQARATAKAAEAEVGGAEAERQRLADAVAAAAAAWAATWPEAHARAADPGALKALVSERTAILAAGHELAELMDRRGRLEAERAPEAAALAFVEGRFGLDPAGLPLGPRLAAARARLEAHRDGLAAYRQDEAAHADALAAQVELEDAHARMAAALADWRRDWAGAGAALGLAADADLQRGTAVAAAWQQLAALRSGLTQSQAWFTRLGDDEARLAADLGHLSRRLADALPPGLPTDPVAAGEGLGRALDDAQEARVRQATLAEKVDECRLAAAAAAAALARASASVAALAATAGVEADRMAAVAARCRDRQRCLADRVAVEARIVIAGDGLPIAGLRDEWGGRDLDGLQAELAEATEEVRRLEAADGAVEQARRDLDEQTRALARFDREAGLNAAIARRESAATRLREAARRYVETTLARDLLARAIDLVRKERQDPLVTHAGRLFRQATEAAYAGIAAEVGDGQQPVVVGERPDGSRVTVDRMSDGTRDQLFLAFRIAAIEHHCRHGEPLPLVADDLLVHFDDRRGDATLALLADLGTRTQVLLFTHHRRVRDAAVRLAEAGRAQVIDIDGTGAG